MAAVEICVEVVHDVDLCAAHFVLVEGVPADGHHHGVYSAFLVGFVLSGYFRESFVY